MSLSLKMVLILGGMALTINLFLLVGYYKGKTHATEATTH